MSIFDKLQPRFAVSILAANYISIVYIEFARYPDIEFLAQLNQIIKKPGFRFFPQNRETRIAINHPINYDSISVAQAVATLCEQHGLSWEISSPSPNLISCTFGRNHEYTNIERKSLTPEQAVSSPSI